MTDKYSSVHETPNGPGDARPTALQIIADEDLQGKWTDRVVFITGCSSGLGVETARALAKTGATLYLTARDLDKAKTALKDIDCHLLKLDLDSLESVRSCAAAFLSQSKQLNTLILNAGVMTTPEGRTQDGFETQFGTNHLAHFLLFNLLKDVLISSSNPEYVSRVVILSSIAHRHAEVDFGNINMDGNYNPLVAYGQSKTANLWTANEIDRRYPIHAWSVQPGGVATGLMQHMDEASKKAALEHPELSKIFKSPEQGAATSVWAATAKVLEGKGGRYLEDCSISKEYNPAGGEWAPGYGKWAYDQEKEGRLWRKSLELVGLNER